ncbi:MBL fold metallo-hydrolase [Bacillus pinisoli]|uniref:MBL fold metallo-hydrolase n=1 Tax=Bacillus pinisoli TaxID=2901866 RepID=UPI001FF16684|nr:MBL fold metallo-hydrolase [Bacillus pinisoli]
MQEVLVTPCEIYCISLPTPFPVGNVNVHIVKSEKLTLVDAGVKTPEAWEHFTIELSKLGFTTDDIEQVVITHHHPDHVGMLDYLPKALPVYGHRFNQPWISKDPLFFEQHDKFYYDLFSKLGLSEQYLEKVGKLRNTLTYSCKRSLTMELKEGDKVPGLNGWTVIETPGHAQSHIVLYHEKSKVVLGGDLLLGHISSNPLIEPPMEGEARPLTLLQYNNSLKRIRDLQLKKVYPGHGDVVTNPSALVTERLHKQEKRAETVLEMLKEHPLTALQVCQQLFPQIYIKEMVLTLSETLGQLDYLVEAGTVGMKVEDGLWVFYSK